MTQEQIEKAARESSTRAGYNIKIAADVAGRTVYECAFEAGAQWRINSVWHPINEDPGYGKYILVHFRSGNYTSWFASADILWDFKRFEVDEWAYVVDLLPADSE